MDGIARAPQGKRNRGFLVQAGSIVLIIFAWYVGSLGVNPILLPAPGNVLQAFIEMYGVGELQRALVVSLIDLAYGVLLTIVVGVTVGIFLGRFEVLEKVLSPYIYFMYSTPTLAFLPLLVVWMGIGQPTRIAVIFTLSAWALMINVMEGVKTTSGAMAEVARAFRLKEHQYVWLLVIPGALPYIMAGIRVALGKAIIGMIMAEMTLTLVGLGGLVLTYGRTFHTAHVLAGVFVSSVIGASLMGLLGLLQKKWFPWIDATSASRR